MLRFGIPYGPRMHSRMVIGSFSERAANRTYDLEGAERISIRQLAELVRELVGDTVID